jgi:hypothetical protein
MTNQKPDFKEDLALILTASIDIQGMPRATPTVPEQRQEDYFKALQYYLENHPSISKLIFIENSGWSLERVKQALLNNPYHKQVEFISLNCNNFPRNFGKGYGECLLIERGLAQSHLAKEVNYIGKITGRIYLRNLEQILHTIKQPFDCFCDYKDQGWMFRKMWGQKHVGPHCDTRFLIFSKSFYEEYIKCLHLNHQSGGFSIERQFYDSIKQAEAKEKIISRFAVEPEFDGVAGHFGGKNYSSKSEKAKFFIRSWSRTVLPWLHL